MYVWVDVGNNMHGLLVWISFVELRKIVITNVSHKLVVKILSKCMPASNSTIREYTRLLRRQLGASFAWKKTPNSMFFSDLASNILMWAHYLYVIRNYWTSWIQTLAMMTLASKILGRLNVCVHNLVLICIEINATCYRRNPAPVRLLLENVHPQGAPTKPRETTHGRIAPSL